MRDAAALLPVAESIADGSAVDWKVVEASAGAEDQAMIRQLRVLAELATVHRTLQVVPAAPRPVTAHRTSMPASHRWARLDLIERIGGGASGEVYRAWDPQLEREVALKLLRADEVVANPQTSRILTEGRMLARIQHPNVVTVFGVTVHDGRLGLWMELVHGATLEDLLAKQGPFSAREATLIGIDLCRALAAIHKARLVHRDVKAQNVLREEGGRIVLMDLGTGREMVSAEPDTMNDLAGTPLYLAPELFEGEPANERTDLFSLGVLLYHLVTRSFPVRAATLEELKHAHTRSERIRLRDARPDLPPMFVRVIDCATASDPADRYESAGALEADLVRSLDDTAPPAADQSPAGWGAKQWAVAIAALVAITAAFVLAATLWRTSSAGEPATSSAGVPGQISVLAVLPFQNLSTDPDEAYLASAVPMELTARLGHIGAVKVVPWTFMKRFDVGGQRSLKEVAERTGAGAIIEGSVQRAPARSGGADRPVQVRVQVYQAGVGALLWSASFERDIGNFFALQHDIAKEVAERIHVVLASREQTQISRTRVVPPDAMEYYLNAKYAFDVRMDIKGSVDLLQRAVQIAPGFAEAYASLASSYALESAYFQAVSSSEALRRALDASSRAIAIDPNLADAWGARAFARFALEWNWPEAENDFRHALEIDPTSVDALIGYSDYLSDRARHAEAIDTARRAEARVPLSAWASRQVAYAYYMAHQYENAIRQLHRTLAIEPQYAPAHTLLGRAYLLAGRTEEGIAELTAAGDDYRLMLALGYAMAGRRDDAHRLLAEAVSPSSNHPVIPYEMALVHIALGETDRAIDWFETGFREKDPSMTALAVDPMVDPIRSDARVSALLTRLRLQQ
jgi:TolB-like protein/tetratricopeptide (TPR) repeat protein/tRNA A-37 threonylcarbamoyl transferase component Bud32